MPITVRSEEALAVLNDVRRSIGLEALTHTDVVFQQPARSPGPGVPSQNVYAPCDNCECRQCWPNGRACTQCTCTICWPSGRTGCPDAACGVCRGRRERGARDMARRAENRRRTRAAQLAALNAPVVFAQVERNDEDDDDEPGEHYLRDHGWRPARLQFMRAHGQRAQLDTPFYGIEVEAECRGATEPWQARRVIEARWPFIYCKADGSLRDGIECVSHPGTFRWWASQGPSIGFAKYLRQAGFLSFKTSTCGMHIHVSKLAFGAPAQAKVIYLLDQCSALFARLSRRQREQLDQWAAITRGGMGAAIRRVKRDHASRYLAVNLRNEHTVEFRLFRGTLSSRGILRNIGLVEALVGYGRTAKIQNVSIADFMRYVQNEAENTLRTEAERGILWDVYDWLTFPARHVRSEA